MQEQLTPIFEPTMDTPRLLIYEPNVGGHQAEFLTWLAEAWTRTGAGALVLAAPAGITQGRPALGAACEASGGAVELVETGPAEAETGTFAHASAIRRAHPLQALIAAHRPAEVLLMSFEHFMAPLAARVRLVGTGRVSALALRPTLHYGALGGPPAGVRTRAVRWARARFVRAAMQHPQFGTLFSLDPTAVPALRTLSPGVRVEAVPDPVPAEPVGLSREAIREMYGVETGRHLFILPGALDARKGAPAIPEALLRLPPEVAARIAVLLAGHVDPTIDASLRDALDRASRTTAAQAVLRDTFVPPDEIQSHVAAADTILLPYSPEHVGSSGFMMRAAGARVPVLSTENGLMGHLTRTHCLGQTFADGPDALATALASVLDAPLAGFDGETAATFAARHTVAAFTNALLSPFLAV